MAKQTPAIKRLGTPQTRKFGSGSPQQFGGRTKKASVGPNQYLKKAGASKVPYGTPGRG